MPRGDAHPLSPHERAVDELLRAAHLASDADLPDLLDRHAVALGVSDALVYVVDLQQRELVPFLGPSGPPVGLHVETLAVDSTLPGRAFQHTQALVQPLVDPATHRAARSRVWLPLLDGAERLGVLAVTLDDPQALEAEGDPLMARLLRFAELAAELVMTKTMYGDTLVRLRRTAAMGLAAELQWSTLPPLAFASPLVTVAAGLEPAYRVAGDTLDYAVDRHTLRFALFDGMGHGLESAQLATLTVAAYRNARRNGQTLVEGVATMDRAVTRSFPDAFVTGQVAELSLETGTLHWVNCGHPDPLLLRGGQLVKTLEAPPRPPLGLGSFDAAEPTLGEERLQPGDLVVFYSDGVVEARSPDGGFFGVDRLVDTVVRNAAADLPAPETVRRVVRALLEHQQDQLADDATLMVVHYRPDDQRGLVPTPVGAGSPPSTGPEVA